jgi:tyrosyl-tRNA synthetase
MIKDSMGDLFSELDWRGLVYDSTEGTSDVLARRTLTLYAGFDATASSLHIGHLLPVLGLARAQRCGHKPIALIGGGTGLIGDPSGKSAERNLLTLEEVRANAEGVRSQLTRFLEFGSGAGGALLENNADWLTTITAMEFLRDVGKYFTVNQMIAKESVKRRMESDDGISYTEFSYSLLQSYDYLILHDRFACSLQIGGSDQWGNIVAGCDLIRRRRGASTHGLVMPLIMTAAGTKFGKTEAGAVWLDPDRTSPFRFYQYWLNVDDRDVTSYLKYFTFRTQDEIAELERETREHPERRTAQRELAREVTAMVHGVDHVARAERAAAVLFGGSLVNAAVDDILMVFDDAPSISIAGTSLEHGIGAADLAVKAGLAASKGEAGRLIKQGGLYVNDRRLNDERGQITMADAIGRAVIVLRKGQRERRIIKVEA